MKTKRPIHEKLMNLGNRQIYNIAVRNKINDMFDKEYAMAFQEILIAGMEPSWMSDYFDTWHYMKEEFKNVTKENFYDEAYEQAHDVAMTVVDGIYSEFGILSEPILSKDYKDNPSRKRVNRKIINDKPKKMTDKELFAAHRYYTLTIESAMDDPMTTAMGASGFVADMYGNKIKNIEREIYNRKLIIEDAYKKAYKRGAKYKNRYKYEDYKAY